MSENSVASIKWQAQLLRFTVFANVEADKPEWWEEVMKDKAEKLEAQPKQNIYSRESPYGSGRFVLQTQPYRTDWVYVINEPDIPEISSLGLYNDALVEFSDIIRKWFRYSNIPTWDRVAYGAVLVYPVDARSESYRQLDKLLQNVKIDAENSSDFSYQINRPRAIGIGDGTTFNVNRLSKWSTAAVVQATVEVDNEEIRHFPRKVSVASRLELDINTAAGNIGSLGTHLLPEVFDKLVEFGNEISIQGDIP